MADLSEKQERTVRAEQTSVLICNKKPLNLDQRGSILSEFPLRFQAQRN